MVTQPVVLVEVGFGSAKWFCCGLLEFALLSGLGCCCIGAFCLVLLSYILAGSTIYGSAGWITYC